MNQLFDLQWLKIHHSSFIVHHSQRSAPFIGYGLHYSIKELHHSHLSIFTLYV